MFAKLSIVLALAAVALCTEYPPGVHPAVCPNYPYCDTAMLARYTIDGQPIPEWVYNPSILPYAPLAPLAPLASFAPLAPFAPLTPFAVPIPAGPTPAAARYPADFDAAKCPNYPYCN